VNECQLADSTSPYGCPIKCYCILVVYWSTSGYKSLWLVRLTGKAERSATQRTRPAHSNSSSSSSFCGSSSETQACGRRRNRHRCGRSSSLGHHARSSQWDQCWTL
jgi:hypothetical protein